MPESPLEPSQIGSVLAHYSSPRERPPLGGRYGVVGHSSEIARNGFSGCFPARPEGRKAFLAYGPRDLPSNLIPNLRFFFGSAERHGLSDLDMSIFSPYL
jgi:hypothetical protein